MAEADLQGGPVKNMKHPSVGYPCAKGWPQLFYADCELDHIWLDWNRGMMASTGRRKPISMSGAGKAVCGILR
jgi:hypothetical protein